MKTVLAALVLLASVSALADPANAIVRLLNSRASGSPRGYAEAAAEVAREAESGRPLYGFVLALVSREKNAPPAARIDEEKRRRYLDACRAPIQRLASEKNNSMAWYLLSMESGDTNLLRRAAEGGNAQALNAWGTLQVSKVLVTSRDTNEISRVLSESCAMFKRAAGDGDANGLYNLGMCHWRGLGAEQNDENALKCFRAAAEKGHPEAINNIGAFFRDGRVVEKDLALATKWFAKSASYDNPFGQFNYALALRRGEGVDKDFAKAFEYLKKAAVGGCIEAVNVMGVAYSRGEGVEKDERNAVECFRRAAADGYPPAMENLSECYANGRGVPADDKLALEWKIRARAAAGDRNAAAWLRQNDERKASRTKK